MNDTATNAATDAPTDAANGETNATATFVQRRSWPPGIICAALIACAAIQYCRADEPAESAAGEAAPADAAPAAAEQTGPPKADLPRHEDGTINYYQVLVDRYSAGVTPENNGAVLLVRALGPEMFGEEVREEALAQLGLSGLSEDGPYLERLYKYYDRTVPFDQQEDYDHIAVLAEITSRPWPAAEYPIAAAWLEANEGPLALAVEASQRSHFYLPKISPNDPPALISAFLPELTWARHVALALTARAMLKLDSGDMEGAWQDVLAMRRLARQVARSSTLIELLVGLGIDGIATEAGKTIMTSDSPTPDLLQAMLTDSLALPPMQSLAENLVGERLFMLDIVEALKRGPSTDDSAGSLDDVLAGVGNDKNVISGLGNEDIDWQALQEAMDYWYSRSINAATAPDYAEHLRLTEELNADFEELTRFMRRTVIKPPTLSVQDKLITMLMPDLSLMRTISEGHEAKSKLYTLALATQLYLARNGEYLAAIEDLTPDYLAEVPIDGFTGEVFKYVRTDDGCKIYSLGPNMIDDGGLNYADFRAARRDVEGDVVPDAVMPKGMTEDADDIVIELGRVEE